MNNTTRVLMLSLMSVAVLAGCKKDVKPTPPADTTTTTFLPAALVRATRAATRRILSTSATDEPPYFWTTIPVCWVKARILRAAM